MMFSARARNNRLLIILAAFVVALVARHASASYSAGALWHFNNNSNDSACSYSGTDTGTSYSTGLLNQAGGFDGSASKIDFGNTFDLTGTETRSWSLWFKPKSLSGLKYVFAKGNDVHVTHSPHGYW